MKKNTMKAGERRKLDVVKFSSACLIVCKYKLYCKCQKRAEFDLYADNEALDIIGIAESWTKR